MELQWIDWSIIAGFMVVSLAIGIAVTRKASSSSVEFFAAGKAMPWWLLGISMVATTFSTDTPNLVTDLVRGEGVSGNWAWWAFLLTGMVTAFLYARLWKRAGVLTDVEFYELRYSGKAAAFLRGFRALYLGFIFNVIVMASVSLAAIKIGGALLGLTPLQTILIGCTVTVIYSTLGGLRGVLFTDLIQFVMAMAGAIGAAYVVVNMDKVGGLGGLFDHPNVADKLSLLPHLPENPEWADYSSLIGIIVLPLAVQWWAAYYPGSEPGGGGYVAQRMLSAKNENNALGAVFLFNVAHYALRPWPWILVALASLVIYPDLDALRAAFPQLAEDGKVANDLAYPAMMTFLPAGLMGLVMASLIAAYMSTISTHLNWGASYLVNDVYKRFVVPGATERHLVTAGRVCTVLLMIAAGYVALQMVSALDNFKIMLSVGAGSGLIYILRWFWWRVNAISEIVAMVVPFGLAMFLRFYYPEGWPVLDDWMQFGAIVAVTTLAWVMVALVTRPTPTGTLVGFYKKVQPGGPGWRGFISRAEAEGHDFSEVDRIGQLPLGILCMVLGCVAVYATLFATGYWLYGNTAEAKWLTGIAVVSTIVLVFMWRRLTYPLRIQVDIDGDM
ncbi:MAG: sodium:solute symporter family protein [Candidatus Hydrogenedentota bacterium]